MVSQFWLTGPNDGDVSCLSIDALMANDICLIELVNVAVFVLFVSY